MAESQDQEYTPCFAFHTEPKKQIEDVCKALRPFFKGLIIANYGFNQETGLKKLQSGTCDAVSFGRLYISNPDLAERIIHGYPIETNSNYKTFYGNMMEEKDRHQGYIDYPFYKK